MLYQVASNPSIGRNCPTPPPPTPQLSTHTPEPSTRKSGLPQERQAQAGLGLSAPFSWPASGTVNKPTAKKTITSIHGVFVDAILASGEVLCMLPHYMSPFERSLAEHRLQALAVGRMMQAETQPVLLDNRCYCPQPAPSYSDSQIVWIIAVNIETGAVPRFDCLYASMQDC